MVKFRTSEALIAFANTEMLTDIMFGLPRLHGNVGYYPALWGCIGVNKRLTDSAPFHGLRCVTGERLLLHICGWRQFNS